MSLKACDNCLSFEGHKVLEGLPSSVSFEHAASGGAFLRLERSTVKDDPFLRFTEHGPDASTWSVPLGKPTFDRALVAHRTTPWWMGPKIARSAADVPSETQFLLGRMKKGYYCLLVPLIDPSKGARCSLRGTKSGLEAVVETNDPAVRPGTMTGLYLAVGTDPYALCAAGAREVASLLGTCRVRIDKQDPLFVDLFGWCTWDAFYLKVDGEKVVDGLAKWKASGIPLSLLILDDGWLSVKPGDAGEKRLSGFGANEKFPGGLRPLVKKAKEDFGIREFMVWHAFQGYWGGIDQASFPQYRVREYLHSYSSAVNAILPKDSLGWWGAAWGIPDGEDMPSFYDAFHSRLALEGVDGVKVDSQATLESAAGGHGGRVRFMRQYREALEASVLKNFKGEMINCMSCVNDMFYMAKDSTVTRTSDDFQPLRTELQGRHIWSNAVNGLWFGEFVRPDWDMFHSLHPQGGFHAAARAVSGGPVYVSDKPGQHDVKLLSALVMSDGTTPRALDAGRPTKDSLFVDAEHEDAVFKVWNRNAAGFVLGAFNCRHGGKRTKAAVSGADIPGLAGPVAVWCFKSGEMAVLEKKKAVEFGLDEYGWEVFTLALVEDGFAVLGLSEKMNSGGTVRSVERFSGKAVVSMRDGGTLRCYSSAKPTGVKSDGRDCLFSWKSGLLTIELPVPGPQETVVLF